MKIATLVFCLLLTASSAVAVTYKWEDSKGVHFSDELSAVPREMRPRELPEDEHGVVTFGKPVPFNNGSALRQQGLQESERLDRERDRIVMEGIRQHQEEVISRVARDRSKLQAYLVRMFAHKGSIWVVPLLLLLYFWQLTLLKIMRSDFTVPDHKYRWLLAVLLLGPVGMAAYYLRGRPRVTDSPPAPSDEHAGLLTRFTARLKKRKQGQR